MGVLITEALAPANGFHIVKHGVTSFTQPFIDETAADLLFTPNFCLQLLDDFLKLIHLVRVIV